MHMRGMPDTMQDNTDYADVVAEVDAYLQARVAACLAAGIAAERLILDPGFGFGKTPAQNMALVRECRRFKHERYPVLLGVSRKSTIGHYLGDAPVGERLHGSVTLAALAAWQGADIVRVHDVAATRDALRITTALHAPG
jgi:dihydropteroate synthase